MVDRDWTVEGVGRSREVREDVIVTCVGGGSGRREVDSGCVLKVGLKAFVGPLHVAGELWRPSRVLAQAAE